MKLTKAQLLVCIEDAKLEISGIEAQIKTRRGAIEDVLGIVLPMHQRQLFLLKQTVQLISSSE